MKVVEAKYTKRLVGERSYEHDELTLTAVFGEDQDAKTGVTALIAMTNACMGLKVSEEVAAKAEKVVKKLAKEVVKEEVKEEVKAETKVVTKKKKVVKEVTEKEVKENFKGEAPKAALKYDRKIKEHTIELAGILTNLYPGWQEKGGKLHTQAGILSREHLPNMDFKDVKGTVLPVFLEKIKEIMGAAEDDAL